MDYVRAHIKHYWGMAYRRTIGVAMVTISVALGIGLTFTILTGLLALSSFYNYVIFWFLLISITLLIFLSNFFAAHVNTVKYMNEDEHTSHSKYMGLWMVTIVVGVFAFLVPLFFVRSYFEPLTLLFTFGGILWLLYLSIGSIFKHRYGELAIGGTAFWVMFLFGIFQLHNFATLDVLTKSYFTLYFTTMTITIITGFVGIALISNSAKESLQDFVTALEKMQGKKSQRKTKRR